MNTEISSPPSSSSTNTKPGKGFINPRGVDRAHSQVEGQTSTAEETSVPPSPRVMFLRDRGNNPIGAIAFLVDEEKSVIRFGYALKHPSDLPNKQIARNVALGHLAKQSREIPFRDTDENGAALQVLSFLSKARGEYKKGGIPIRLPVCAQNTLDWVGRFRGLAYKGPLCFTWMSTFWRTLISSLVNT